MTLLKSRQGLFILLDGGLQLLDVFGASLTERCLGLTVALLTFLGGGIYLPEISHDMEYKGCESFESTHWFPPAFAFLGLSGFLGSWFGTRVLLWRGFDRAGSTVRRSLDLGRGSHIALDVVAISHL